MGKSSRSRPVSQRSRKRNAYKQPGEGFLPPLKNSVCDLRSDHEHDIGPSGVVNGIPRSDAIVIAECTRYVLAEHRHVSTNVIRGRSKEVTCKATLDPEACFVVGIVCPGEADPILRSAASDPDSHSCQAGRGRGCPEVHVDRVRGGRRTRVI